MGSSCAGARGRGAALAHVSVPTQPKERGSQSTTPGANRLERWQRQHRARRGADCLPQRAGTEGDAQIANVDALGRHPNDWEFSCTAVHLTATPPLPLEALANGHRYSEVCEHSNRLESTAQHEIECEELRHTYHHHEQYRGSVNWAPDESSWMSPWNLPAFMQKWKCNHRIETRAVLENTVSVFFLLCYRPPRMTTALFLSNCHRLPSNRLPSLRRKLVNLYPRGSL